MQKLEKFRSFFKITKRPVKAKRPKAGGKTEGEKGTEKATDGIRLVKMEEMRLEEVQQAEQLYNSASLDPVVDAGLKDYDKTIQRENRLLNRVFGLRESDVSGYGKAVAKRTASAVYSLLNKQYGGKVGDMRSYIMSLEDERDRANTRYDELMGRVIGILGDEYKQLRVDSNAFMERLTSVIGDDIAASNIDQKGLAERLSDIDGLRSQIIELKTEREEIYKQRNEQLVQLKESHEDEINNLKTQISELEKVNAVAKDKYEVQAADLQKEHRAEIRDWKSQLRQIERGKEKLSEKYEARIVEITNEYKQEAANLQSQINELKTKLKTLDLEKSNLAADLTKTSNDYAELKATVTSLYERIQGKSVDENVQQELYDFVLKDSKVPKTVIDGVGKFIDLKKYLGIAAEKGARDVNQHLGEIIKSVD